MLGSGRARTVTVAAAALAAVAIALMLAPAGGSGDRLQNAWSIGRIQAVFSEADRATTYSVLDVGDVAPGGKVSYAWTLSLQPVDPTVDFDGLTIDAGCNNHGVLAGTASTFVWHHGNTGDPLHDDGCDHDLQGKYGHQGLITVVVSDGLGTQCTTTYKGTLSSDSALTLGLDVNSEPVCTGVDTQPPPPPPPPPPPKPCKCIQLTARIVPESITANRVIVHDLTLRRKSSRSPSRSTGR